MKVEDEEKTAFITPYGVFCYTTMPFGLKNAGATYQRCMQACLKEQIGRNVQVYVDDIVIKTRVEATLLEDIAETFAALKEYQIKLNPDKMRIQSTSRTAARVPHVGQRHRGQPRENSITNGGAN